MLFGAGTRNGFTLVEVVIAVAIVGIAASLTLVNFPQWMSTFRLREAVRRLASTLQYVRMRAIATNLEYRVRLVAGEGSYRIEHRDGMGGWRVDGGTVFLPASVTFDRGSGDPVTFPGDAVIFRPDGSLRGLSGGVYFKGGEKGRYRITVLSATGRVRMERGWGPYEPRSP